MEHARERRCDFDSEMNDDAQSMSGSWSDDILRWVLDRWIQVLGIVFLLLGVGFLFKYSYELGLFIPPLRVLCGLGIGGALAFAGWRLREDRRALAHVLLGGASATFYITLFAAGNLYELIPGPAAFAAMMAVTMATFVTSVTERGVMLAIVATIGGFVTPFLLDVPLVADPHLNDVFTVVYMCIVLTGSTAVFLYRGWRSVLVISAVAMWGYLVLVATGASTPLEQFGAQGAIVFSWLATGIVPVARLYFAAPRSGGPDATGRGMGHLFAVTTPVIAMVLSRAIWTIDDPLWGVVSFLLAGGYAAAYLYMRRLPRGRGLATTLALIAIGFTTLALTDFLSGSTLMTGLLIEAVALCWLGGPVALGHLSTAAADGTSYSPGSWYRPDRLIGLVGHALLAAVCMHTISLFADPVSMPFVGPEGVQLLMTALALALVGRLHEPEAIRPGFEWAAHVLFLAAVLHQSAPMAHGDLVATACWGIHSLVLITVGLSTRRTSRQWMGLVALLVAAGKLLLVDMSGAETLWRVLLFCAFGIALLLLSYLSPRWTGRSAETNAVA